MLNVWRHNDGVMFLGTFEVLSTHVSYNALERAHQGEVWTWKSFVDITKIEWDLVFLILNNTIANCEFPPWEKSRFLATLSFPFD